MRRRKYLTRWFPGRSEALALRRIVPSLLGAIVVASPAHAAPGLDQAEPIASFLNGALPASAPGAVEAGSGAWTQRNYFPDVSFIEPLRVVEHPTRNELIIVGKDALGHIITHREGATDKRLFFDLRSLVQGNPESGEGGISDIAFHPQFGRGNSYVFMTYWWSPDNSGTFSNDSGVDGYNRLSRFEVRDGQVDISTEQVMINQYDREYWHIAGDLAFGEDGFLYISAGDETPTTCCDRADSTQRLDGGLWSGILRIDVDNDVTKSHPIRRQPRHPGADPRDNGDNWPLSFSQGYSIPNDNPFLSPDGSRLEEFYSLGLRHPWTMSLDAATGDIWVGDVGRFQREEIDRVRKGDNSQWPFREGLRNGPDRPPADVIGNSAPPVWDYDHETGRSVIMAGVYRGSAHPDLVGKVLFSDFVRGQLWTATPGGSDASGYDVERIGSVSAGWTNGISSYLLDSKGQILMVRSAGALRDGGRIDILTRENPGTRSAQPPALLSQTGAFTDLLARTPVEGCIPYEENVPFWSDAAVKSRWMCVPNDGQHDSAGERIVYSEDGAWTFPVGTVFIKHFDMEASEGNARSAFPLETRFLVVTSDGYYGLSYRWNDDGSDATLVAADGDTRGFRQTSPAGETADRNWDYPSRGECLECHTRNAGSTLGVNTRQLNGDHTYVKTGRAANQIETLAHLGLFGSGGDGIVESLPTVVTARAADDLSAPLADRARSYLDANCGYCHQPGGVRALFDGRLTTPLAEQGIINGELIESVGIDGEAVLVPGDLERSVIHHRASRLGNQAMPPLAKNRVDDAGVALLSEWIRDLGADGSEPGPVTQPEPETEPEPDNEGGMGDGSVGESDTAGGDNAGQEPGTDTGNGVDTGSTTDGATPADTDGSADAGGGTANPFEPTDGTTGNGSSDGVVDDAPESSRSGGGGGAWAPWMMVWLGGLIAWRRSGHRRS